MSVIPRLTSVFYPVIVSSLATPDPGMVVSAATSTQDFSSRVGLFDSRILGTVDQGRLVLPVIVTSAQLECSSWGHDFRDVFRITRFESLRKPLVPHSN